MSPEDLGKEVTRLFRDFAAHGGEPRFLFCLWTECLEIACQIELHARRTRLSHKVQGMRPGLISAEGEIRRLESSVLRAGARPLSFPAAGGPDQTSAQLRAKMKFWIQAGSLKIGRAEGTPARLHSRAVLLAAMEPYMSAKKMLDPTWRRRWLREWISVTDYIPPHPNSLKVMPKMLDRLPYLAKGKLSDGGVVSAFTETFSKNLDADVVGDPLKWWNTQGKKNPCYALSRRMGRVIARSYLR